MDKEKVELYKKYIKKRHRKRKEKNIDMVGKVDKATTLARKENLTNKEKKELKKLMNSAMKAAIKRNVSSRKKHKPGRKQYIIKHLQGGSQSKKKLERHICQKSHNYKFTKSHHKILQYPKTQEKNKHNNKKDSLQMQAHEPRNGKCNPRYSPARKQTRERN